MAFSTFEFPNVDLYNSDLRELIRYYRELHEIYSGLQNEIQELYDFINNFETNLDQKIKDQIAITMAHYQQRLIAVEKLVADLETKVEKNADEIDTIKLLIPSIKDELNVKILQLWGTYNDLVELFHEYKENIDQYVDMKTEELKQYIIDNVTHLERLNVINPMTGIFEDINKVLNDIYNSIQLAFGITAREYDKMQIAAHAYDTMAIMANDYDTHGYLLFWELKQGMMISPFTGGSDKISNVVDKLAQLHKCTYTAQQYDDMRMTAQEYDAWLINAYNYDWFGRQIALQKRALTAKDYDDKKVLAKNFDKRAITAYRYDKYGYVLFYDTVLNTTTYSCMACNPETLSPILRSAVPGNLTAEDYDSNFVISKPYDDLQVSSYDYDIYGKQIIMTGSKYIEHREE